MEWVGMVYQQIFCAGIGWCLYFNKDTLRLWWCNVPLYHELDSSTLN